MHTGGGDEAAKVYLALCFLQDAAKKIGLIFLLKFCWTWVDFERVAVIQLHGMNTIYNITEGTDKCKMLQRRLRVKQNMQSGQQIILEMTGKVNFVLYENLVSINN